MLLLFIYSFHSNKKNIFPYKKYTFRPSTYLIVFLEIHLALTIMPFIDMVCFTPNIFFFLKVIFKKREKWCVFTFAYHHSCVSDVFIKLKCAEVNTHFIWRFFCMLAGPCGQTEKVSFLQGDTWCGNLWQGNRKKDGQEDNCQEGGQSATGKTVGYFD